MAAITTTGLTKDYGGGRGVFDLDLNIEEGEIFGFLGPNGAGKTTTLRLLMDLIRPTSGTATVFGLDTRASSVEVKRLVGYLPGELPDFGRMRASEVVAVVAGLRRMEVSATVSSLCRRLDLDLSPRYEDLSRGTKQKLGLALAMMVNPRLLILDEPTGGLDPLVQQEFGALLREARDAGVTILLSSHVLSEVEQLCDRAAVVRTGRLVRTLELHGGAGRQTQLVEIEFSGAPPVAAVLAAANTEDVRVEGQTIHCTVRGDVGPLIDALSHTGVRRLSSREPSLEEVFLELYRDPSTS